MNAFNNSNCANPAGRFQCGDWQIMFTGTTASTNPVNGDTYGSVVGVSAANFGDTSVYDVESVIVNATIDFRLTQNKSHAVCVFREQYLDTATR